MARAIVDMPLSLLFVQNHLWNTEKKSIQVLQYALCTKLLEDGLLSEHAISYCKCNVRNLMYVYLSSN